MRLILMICLLFGFAQAADAKLPTTQVTLSGPQLADPVHTNAADIIAPNVWMGDFADLEGDPVPAPPEVAQRITAYFWVNDQGTQRIAYAVDLVFDIEGQTALVYLPGPRDPRFANNTRSILRRGQDGRWFRADAAWAAAINQALSEVESPAPAQSGEAEFKRVMQRLAAAWNEGDSRAAADCFTEDAIYSQPPGKQLYRGRDALFEYFGGEKGRPGAMLMHWHKLAFDSDTQTGIGEFSFRYGTYAHGVAVVQVRNGRISRWREYYVESTAPWHEFTKENIF